MIETLFPAGWQHYAIGGLWIGAATALVFVVSGLVAGMSTVFTTTWSYVSSAPYFQQRRFVDSRAWRLLFAGGLIVGAWLWRVLVPPHEAVVTSLPVWQLFAGGALVGFGARMSNGCTSGHGICGLASLQWPSLAAVLTFLATAMVTAQVTWWVWGR